MTDDLERLVPMREVLQRVPVDRRTLWLWIKQGRFPQPRRPGGKFPFWLESELVAWMRETGQQGSSSQTNDDVVLDVRGR